MGRGSATSLAPGFRFHPTDEELVRYYLKRKVSGKSFRFDPISVVDIYKSEPWDLPDKSKLKSRDLEWYFFSVLDKKYGNSSRTNRATEKGYWKTTGKDRPVRHYSRTVGMKKTLVYHNGRAPRGARTNWVMHEYRLIDEELEKAGIIQDAFVLCRVFQKSGSGPKNGEQYGAPFIEEEWEDDEELALVPGQDLVDDEVLANDDVYIEADDFEQDLDEGITSDNAQHSSDFYYGSTSNYAEQSNELIEDEQKPTLGMDDDNMKFFVSPEQFEWNGEPVKNEYFTESCDNVNPANMNYLLDEPFLGTSDPSNDGLFLESNDLSYSIDADPTGFDLVEEYLTFFDADSDNADMSFDPSEILDVENPVPDQAPLTEKLEDGTVENVPVGSIPQSDNDASSSKQKPEVSNMESDIKYPFSKVSEMLGSIPAPPAFASEFPSKHAALRLNSAAQASSSVHVTAGMIEIRSLTYGGNGMDCLFGKNAGVNLIFSFDVSQGDIDSPPLLPLAGLLSDKTGFMVSRGFSVFFILFWVLILSMSFKVGSCIYSR